MSKWEKIGEFCVDSGCFIICDPCYLIGENTEKNIEIIDKECFDMVGSTQENVNVRFNKDLNGLAIIGNTIIGDGLFEVFQRINDKGQKEVKIIF